MRRRKDKPGAVLMPALLAGITVIFICSAIVVVFISGASLSRGEFFSFSNFLGIFGTFAPKAAAAAAIVLTLRAGGADLSGFGWIGVYSVVIAMGSSSAVGLLTAVGISVIIGAFNGALIAFAKAPGMLVTALVGLAGNGVKQILKAFQARPVLPQYSLPSGKAEYWINAIYLVVVVVASVIALRYFADDGKVGWNGIRRNKYRVFLMYIISAVLFAISANMYTIRLGLGEIGVGPRFFECAAIASCVIGMRHLTKRQLTVFAAMLPALMISIMNNMLVWMHVNSFNQECINFVVMITLVVAAVLLTVRERKTRRSVRARVK
ncbi:MAG: ABC transporter permease [Christensenellaceae bacterium]|nr:ABC transporter permease [Christensenellaceae bacterium]